MVTLLFRLCCQSGKSNDGHDCWMSDFELGPSESHCPELDLSRQPSHILGIVFLSSVTSFYYFLVDNEFLLTLRLYCYNLYKYCSLSIDPLARLRGSLLNTLTARISDYLTFHIRTHHSCRIFSQQRLVTTLTCSDRGLRLCVHVSSLLVVRPWADSSQLA